MRKIGLYGGTFDPIHNGHIHVAELAMERVGLDGVIFIPTGDPPHKTDQKVTNKEDRFRMAEAAISGRDEFSISDYEIRSEELSYSVETAKHFTEEYPGDRLYFIIGADSFADMPSWWRYRELMELVNFIVVTRPDTPKRDYLARFDGDEKPPRVFLIDGVMMDISSTMIREKLKHGESAKGMVPDPVLSYIREKKLYQ